MHLCGSSSSQIGIRLASLHMLTISLASSHKHFASKPYSSHAEHQHVLSLTYHSALMRSDVAALVVHPPLLQLLIGNKLDGIKGQVSDDEGTVAGKHAAHAFCLQNGLHSIGCPSSELTCSRGTHKLRSAGRPAFFVTFDLCYHRPFLS